MEDIAVQGDPKKPQPTPKMLEMSQALAELRDSWVKLSVIFADMLTEIESPMSYKVKIEVERYLTRLRDTEL